MNSLSQATRLSRACEYDYDHLKCVLDGGASYCGGDGGVVTAAVSFGAVARDRCANTPIGPTEQLITKGESLARAGQGRVPRGGRIECHVEVGDSATWRQKSTAGQEEGHAANDILWLMGLSFIPSCGDSYGSPSHVFGTFS